MNANLVSRQLTQNPFRKLVQRADKQTGARQSAVNYALAHIGKPYDLVNVPEECPNISNTCQVGVKLSLMFSIFISISGATMWQRKALSA